MGIFKNAPPQLLKDQYRRQLVPGTVVRFEAQLSPTTRKVKRWVIVALDDVKIQLFVINTKPSQLVIHNAAMAKCQAFMEQVTHTFMSHDSYVDCFRPRIFDLNDVLDEFVKDTLGNGANPVLGKITLQLRDDMVGKLLQSSATSPQQKTDFAASLNSMN